MEQVPNKAKLLNAFKIVAIFSILYMFLVSIGMIGSGFKGLGRGFAEELLSSSAAPLIGLFIGILATSLIQSSSTTTSLVVGMVAAGTFGILPNMVNEIEAIQKMQDDYINAMVSCTSLSKRKLKSLLNERVNIYLTAQEAVEYGLADIII